MAEEIKAGTSANGAMVLIGEPGPELVEVEEAPPQLDHPALRETGNGPEVSYEEALLQEFYGDPDEDGVYGRHG